MDTFSHVPPGFRFHPTDEELVDYYLRKKVNGRRIDLDVIKDVDLYKIEPWDLQEICKIGNEEQNDWYFFSHKDKKYPTGTRTNRATASGFWKATGRDKSIYSKNELIGMRKTLVFYQGRAPNGQKSDWIMHEYRLETDENGTSQEEGWVVCRAFKKKIATMRSRLNGHDSPIWYNDDQVSFMQDSYMESPDQHGPSIRMTHTDSFMQSPEQHGPCVRMTRTDPFMESTDQHQPSIYNNYPNYPCKKEHENIQYQIAQDHFLQLPLLQSPNMQNINSSLNSEFNTNVMDETGMESMHQSQDQSHLLYMNNQNMVDDQHVTDWRVLDKFVASQLSQEEMCKENEYITNQARDFHNSDDSHMMMINNLENQENCQIDLRK